VDIYTIVALERLQRLRNAGTLSEVEFLSAKPDRHADANATRKATAHLCNQLGILGNSPNDLRRSGAILLTDERTRSRQLFGFERE
jgi:hypothetical protein